MSDVNSELVTAQVSVAAALRPYSDYSDRDYLVETVMDRIAKGETLTKVCAEPDMPSVSSFFRWIQGDETKWSAYLQARETQAHVFASKVVDVAYEQLDPALIKVRSDALKWAAARGAPKHFGDSTQLRHADADGGKLDTGPLVSELLGLMTSHNAASGADAPAQGKVSARLVSEAPAVLEHKEASGPAYRPRSPRLMGIEDLV